MGRWPPNLSKIIPTMSFEVYFKLSNNNTYHLENMTFHILFHLPDVMSWSMSTFILEPLEILVMFFTWTRAFGIPLPLFESRTMPFTPMWACRACQRWFTFIKIITLRGDLIELTSQMNSIRAFLFLFHSASSSEAGGYFSQPSSKVISKSFEDR